MIFQIFKKANRALKNLIVFFIMVLVIVNFIYCEEINFTNSRDFEKIDKTAKK